MYLFLGSDKFYHTDSGASRLSFQYHQETILNGQPERSTKRVIYLNEPTPFSMAKEGASSSLLSPSLSFALSLLSKPS
jgi:hypothetical protein